MGSIEERLRRLDQKVGFKRPLGQAAPRPLWAIGAWLSTFNAVLLAGMLLRGVAEGWADVGVIAVLIVAVVSFSCVAGVCFTYLWIDRRSDHRTEISRLTG